MQYNTIQYNTIQYNTIQYNTIQYNTIQKDFELAIGSGAVMIVLMGAIFWLFCTGNDNDDIVPSAKPLPPKDKTGTPNKKSHSHDKIVEDVDKGD